MHYHILTLFPQMIEQLSDFSILSRAKKAGLISVDAVDIRDFTEDRHKKVDDYPYGGGAGMLMQAQPVFDACNFVKKKISKSGRKNPKVIFLSPQGRTFTQNMAEELSKEEDLIFLCGHYEGIDERVLEEVVTDEVSIGDYILTGGELAAMVMIDSISRLVPGVLNNEESAHTESFFNDLLEYPQYTRPEIWHNKKVPDVLLSGDHKKIDDWRTKISISRTKSKRPDLFQLFQLKERAIDRLMENKLIHINMIETIRLGRGEILYFKDDGMAVLEKESLTCMITANSTSSAVSIYNFVRNAYPDVDMEFVLQGNALIEDTDLLDQLGLQLSCICNQAVYTRKVPLPVPKEYTFKILGSEYEEVIRDNYHLVDDPNYVRERIQKGVMVGAFRDSRLLGFVGEHSEGSAGMLFVFPEYQKKGVGTALESYKINQLLSQGKIPYGHIIVGNEKSTGLQNKLSLRISRELLGWYDIIK